jgi:hypothetical protein
MGSETFITAGSGFQQQAKPISQKSQPEAKRRRESPSLLASTA